MNRCRRICFVATSVFIASAHPQQIDSLNIHVYNLPNSFVTRIDSIIINVKDAFEGSRINISLEEQVFRIGNLLHVKTQVQTARRYLLFSEGDIVTSTQLVESEKNLRSAPFIADARIFLRPGAEGKSVVFVTLYDQWSTTPGSSMKRFGGIWTYWLGLTESNFLGTGQRISLSIHEGLLRRGYRMIYRNSAWTNSRIQLALCYADYDDGSNLFGSVKKPLLSKHDRYGFNIEYSDTTTSLWYYFDANKLDNHAPAPESGIKTGRTNRMIEYTNVRIRRTFGEITRSFGLKTKIDVSFFSAIYVKTFDGEALLSDESFASLPSSLFEIRERDDRLVGFKIKLFQTEYGTTKNLRNVRWMEDFDRLRQVQLVLGKNFPQSRGRDDEVYLGCRVKYSNVFRRNHFLNMHLNTLFYLTSEGQGEDGLVDAGLRYQVKFAQATSGYLSTSWKNYFGRLPNEQIVLGDESELHGYPNFYFAGQAMLRINAEVVVISHFEVATIIPAMAFFISTGNTFPDYKQTSLNHLHTSIGFGLRLGATRAVDRVVNHLNISWPLDRFIKGPVISIRSKTSL